MLLYSPLMIPQVRAVQFLLDLLSAFRFSLLLLDK